MTPIEKLKRLLKEDKVVPVVGAGVSYATAGFPGWKGLIKSGLEFARERNLHTTEDYRIANLYLENNQLTKAADALKKILEAPNNPFAEWLNDLFYDPTCGSLELIDSIHDLCAPILLTTNYDTLLNVSNSIFDREVFDWKGYQQVQRAVNMASRFNLHLHGIYTKPETIIL